MRCLIFLFKYKIFFLIEPGLIQLNRLIREDNMVFEKLKKKKIILNKSILTPTDVADFEREAGTKVFFNMPPVDDKDDNIKIQISHILLFLLRIGDSFKDCFGVFACNL